MSTSMRSILGAIVACVLLAEWAAPAAADAYGTAVSADSPLAWWRMADGQDQTGTHTTSLVGTGVTFGQPGPILGDTTGAALFSGTTDGRMKVDDTPDLNFGSTGDFSIEVWVRKASSTGSRAIVNKGDTNASYWLRFQGDQLRFLLDYGSPSTWYTAALSDASYGDDQWHHVVAVAKRDTSIRLYVDGSMVKEEAIVPISEGGGSVSSTGKALEIGQLGGSSPYNGLIDEMAIYGHNLSAAQVQAHYLAGTGVSGSYSSLITADSPLAWWRMDNEMDSAGAHHGVYGGGVTFGQPGAIAGDTSTAARFDGTSEGVILVADAPELNFGTDQDFAVEAWVMRAPEVTGTTAALNKGDTNGSYWLRFSASGNLVFTLDYGPTNDSMQSPLTYNDGLWHYVVGTADRDGMVQLYVDGALVKEATVAKSNNVSSTLPLDIGQMNNGAFYNGMMDELAIYGTALTDARILAHYKAASGASPIPGDANGDGKVDDADASILAANWLRTGDATWEQGDFNNDGSVNDLDASILAANWLAGAGAAVPEPSTWVLLAGMVAALLGWHRRR